MITTRIDSFTCSRRYGRETRKDRNPDRKLISQMTKFLTQILAAKKVNETTTKPRLQLFKLVIDKSQ